MHVYRFDDRTYTRYTHECMEHTGYGPVYLTVPSNPLPGRCNVLLACLHQYMSLILRQSCDLPLDNARLFYTIVTSSTALTEDDKQRVEASTCKVEVSGTASHNWGKMRPCQISLDHANQPMFRPDVSRADSFVNRSKSCKLHILNFIFPTDSFIGYNWQRLLCHDYISALFISSTISFDTVQAQIRPAALLSFPLCARISSTPMAAVPRPPRQRSRLFCPTCPWCCSAMPVLTDLCVRWTPPVLISTS